MSKQGKVGVTVKKDYILEKLYALVGLCEKVEPDIPKYPADKDPLFSNHILTAQELFNKTEQEYGYNDHFDLGEVMRQANKLWRLMNKFQDGDFTGVDTIILDEQIEDFLTQGQKINAIKHYRTVMTESFGAKPTLRECKDYVDTIHKDLKERKVIS